MWFSNGFCIAPVYNQKAFNAPIALQTIVFTNQK